MVVDRRVYFPFFLHERVSHSVSVVAQAVEGSVKTWDQQVELGTINILYHVPKWGANVHLLPSVGNTRTFGPSGVFFNNLKYLNPTLPEDDEIHHIAEIASHFPFVVDATVDFLGKLRTLVTTADDVQLSRMQKQGLVECFCLSFETRNTREQKSVQRALEGLLKCFRAFDKDGFLNILALDSDLLFLAVRALLSFLPQFDWADGSFIRFLKNGRFPQEIGDIRKTRGVVWINTEQKLHVWGMGLASKSPATRLFYLLSAVEAVQWAKDKWDENCWFAIISNLNDFFTTNAPSRDWWSLSEEDDNSPRCFEDCRNSYYESCKTASVPLQRLSIYFTCSHAPNDQDGGTRLVTALVRRLFDKRDHLLFLVNAMHEALESVLPSHNLGSWRMGLDSACQSLLHVLDPSKVVALRSLYYPSGGHDVSVRYRRASEDEARKLRPSEILSDPWGVYLPASGAEKDSLVESCKRLAHPFEAEADRMCFQLVPAREDSLRVAFGFPNPATLQQVKDSSAFIGLLIANASRLADVMSHGIPYDWYRRSFGPQYAIFDKYRHVDTQFRDISESRDDVPRRDPGRDNEAAFYEHIFKRYSSEKVAVLDVGIGYGRLAEKLVRITSNRAVITGIELCPYLQRTAQSVTGVNKVVLGDMRDTDLLVSTESFDLVVFAFTTFGYFADDKSNCQTLSAAASVLAPGGTLVIEQFCPKRQFFARPPWCPPPVRVVELPAELRDVIGATDDQANLHLIKTTQFVPQPHHRFTSYEGEYSYYLNQHDTFSLVRRDPYCVHLYYPSWFQDELRRLGLQDLECFWDFDVADPNSLEDADKATWDDKELFICVARKLLSARPEPVNEEHIKLAHTRLLTAQNLLERLREKMAKQFNKGNLFSQRHIKDLIKKTETLLTRLSKTDHNAMYKIAAWDTDTFALVEKANSARPSEWEEDDLLKNALESLVSLLSELSS